MERRSIKEIDTEIVHIDRHTDIHRYLWYVTYIDIYINQIGTWKNAQHGQSLNKLKLRKRDASIY